MLTSNLQRTRSSEIPDGTVHRAPLGLDAYSGMDQPIFAQKETMKETEWTPNPDDSISYFRMITDQGYCTDAVRKHVYSGNGTEEDPFVVSWLVGDSRNPYNWSLNRRAFLTAAVAMPLMATALGSSAYTGSNVQILQDFPASNEVSTQPSSRFTVLIYPTAGDLGPLGIRPWLRIRTLSMGTVIRALRSAGHLRDDFRCLCCIQCRVRNCAQHRDAAGPSLFCWFDWIFTFGKCRRTGRRHVWSPPGGISNEPVLPFTIPRTCPRSGDRRLHLRKYWLAMG